MKNYFKVCFYFLEIFLVNFTNIYKFNIFIIILINY